MPLDPIQRQVLRDRRKFLALSQPEVAERLSLVLPVRIFGPSLATWESGEGTGRPVYRDEYLPAWLKALDWTPEAFHQATVQAAREWFNLAGRWVFGPGGGQGAP